MPGVSTLQATPMDGHLGGDASDLHPETSQLLLPSELSGEARQSCCPRLLDKEVRLHEAQADDALHHVRRQVCVRMGLIHYKHVQVDGPGQQSNMQACNLISHLSDKLNWYVNRYERTHKVVLAAHPDSTWNMRYHHLSKEDIRAPTVVEKSLGSGRRELSWIWQVQCQDHRDLPGDTSTSHEAVHKSTFVQSYMRVKLMLFSRYAY